MKRLFLYLCMALVATWAGAQGLPEDGKTYYLYCDNDEAQYFYNNQGQLAVSTTLREDEPAYLWRVTKNGSAYILQNMAAESSYMGFKEMVDAPFSWTLGTTYAKSKGNVTMRGAYGARTVFLVMKNDGQFDQASAPFDKKSTDFSSDFCFVEYTPPTGRPITILCNYPQAMGQFSLEGTTKQGDCTFYYEPSLTTVVVPLTGESGNAAYRFEGFFAKDQSLGTKVDANTLQADTLEARFSLDIFCQEYGQKWVRFGTAETNNSSARSNGSNTPSHVATDISSTDFLWCFVGTPDDFLIYNHTQGESVALTADDTIKAEPVYFKTSAQATHWHILDNYARAADGAGFVITPVGTTSLGLNSYGGVTGFPLKFWYDYGAGTHWNFELIDAEGTTVVYNITGDNPFAENNFRVSYLSIQYGKTVNYKSLTTDSNGQRDTYYLPVGEEIKIEESVPYRGYKLTGVEKAEGGVLNVNFAVDEDSQYQYLWYSNSPEGHPYRIPAIVNTRKNVLLAINDYRPSGADIGYGEVDLMIRRSRDNGATWEKGEILANGEPRYANTYPYFGYGYGDAAVVADRESDQVLAICVSGKVPYPSSSASQRPCVARIVSLDGGETWHEPEEITSQFFGSYNSLLRDTEASIDCFGGFFGSGKILQSRVVKRDKYYRLYAAMLCRGTGVSGAYVVYSDDFGQTWKLLSAKNRKAAEGSDEPKVEELPNGAIVLSGRKSGGRYFNVWNWSDDTFTRGAWSSASAVASNEVSGGIKVGNNSCNGEILLLDAVKVATGERTSVLLQSLPWGNGRYDVGIWFKEIDATRTYSASTIAQNWTKGLQVSDRSSAYSTMCLQSDLRIGFFYEEDPNGYCMVYVPLTLEQITNGEFRIFDPATDGLQRVTDAESAATSSVLTDLSGRRTRALQKGIYIRNGKKVVVR